MMEHLPEAIFISVWFVIILVIVYYWIRCLEETVTEDPHDGEFKWARCNGLARACPHQGGPFNEGKPELKQYGEPPILTILREEVHDTIINTLKEAGVKIVLPWHHNTPMCEPSVSNTTGFVYDRSKMSQVEWWESVKDNFVIDYSKGGKHIKPAPVLPRDMEREFHEMIWADFPEEDDPHMEAIDRVSPYAIGYPPEQQEVHDPPFAVTTHAVTPTGESIPLEPGDVLSTDPKRVLCPLCYGSGMIPDPFLILNPDVKCPKCKGSGKITPTRYPIMDERDSDTSVCPEHWMYLTEHGCPDCNTPPVRLGPEVPKGWTGDNPERRQIKVEPIDGVPRRSYVTHRKGPKIDVNYVDVTDRSLTVNEAHIRDAYREMGEGLKLSQKGLMRATVGHVRNAMTELEATGIDLRDTAVDTERPK